MKVVSDASPLIALARIDGLELLPKLYGDVLISTEVYGEVAGAGCRVESDRCVYFPHKN